MSKKFFSFMSSEVIEFKNALKSILENVGVKIDILKKETKDFLILNGLMAIVHWIIINYSWIDQKWLRIIFYLVSGIILTRWLTYVLYPLKIIFQNALGFWVMIIGYKTKKYEEICIEASKVLPVFCELFIGATAVCSTYTYFFSMDVTFFEESFSENVIGVLGFICCFATEYITRRIRGKEPSFNGWVIDSNKCNNKVEKIWKEFKEKGNIIILLYSLIPVIIIDINLFFIVLWTVVI